MKLNQIKSIQQKLGLKLPRVPKATQSLTHIIYRPISWPIFGAAVILGTLLIIIIFSLLAYQIYFFERIYGGVYIDNIDASAMPRREAQQLIHERANALLQRQITLINADRSWTFTVAELGARIDEAAMVDQAFTIGRGGGFFADLLAQRQTVSDPINIQPVIIFDSGPANQQLLEIAQLIARAPREAELSLNDQLTVEVVTAEAGHIVDIPETRDVIRQAILLRGEKKIDIKIKILKPTITEIEPTRSNIEALLKHPLVFTFEDKQWIIEPQTLADLISFHEKLDEAGKGHIVARLNRAPLATYFHNLSTEINQTPVDAWFHLDVATWTLQPLIPSRNRITLDVAAAVEQTIALLNQPGRHTLALPVVVESPTVSLANADQLGIRELVSSNTSYFKGSSPERMQNIAVSATKFHGLVIPPGGIFSFNEHLGEVDAENGFVESLIIHGDRTAVGIGGGVCQVSTTVFRAAFYGGFELVERWAHGYRVSWYETGSIPGLDATIYSPTVDFKFRNDTNAHLLIQTTTDLYAGTVTFNFYGTSPQRTVLVSEPVEANYIPHGEPVYEEDPSLQTDEVKQVDWAKDGVDVTVYRTVKQGEQVLHQDQIFSRYQPWRAVYKIGPGTQLPVE